MTSRIATTPTDRDRPRALTRGMRWFLRAGALLAIIAGTQLTLLTEHTDLYFFWTIDSPITAAFLGATFSAASLLALVASRQELFVRAVLAVPAVGLVSTLLLIATLQHLEAFDHPISPIWIEVYVFLPPAIVFFLAQQLAVPGRDPRSQTALPPWMRLVLGAQALAMISVGGALFVAAGDVGSLWPWPLTELTSQAVGAWLIGIGATAATIAWRDDGEDVYNAALAYLALGGLAVAGLIRYGGDVSWDEAAAPAYLALVSSWIVVGAAGALDSFKAGRFVTRAPARQSFFSFQIGQHDGKTTVDVTVPRDAVELLDLLNGGRGPTVAAGRSVQGEGTGVDDHGGD